MRKGSIAQGPGQASTSMRPRANTISHIDGAHMQLMASANANVARGGLNTQVHNHSRHPSLAGLPMQNDYHFGGMSNSMGQRGMNHGLPKLETHSFNNMDFGGGLRTAPPMGAFPEFDYEGLLFGAGSNTINPNALHYSDSPQSMAMDLAQNYNQFPDMSTSQALEENFDWMNSFEHQMNFQDANNENAIDGSSPSAISTASQSGISEVMLTDPPATSSASLWQQSMMAPPLMTPNAFSMDLGNPGFHDIMNGGGMSPHSGPQKNGSDAYFSTPPPSMSSMSPSMMSGIIAQPFHPPMNLGPETPISMNSSLYTTLPLTSITDATRQALQSALAQATPFGARKYSFPATSSPLSPHFPGRGLNATDGSRILPSKLRSQYSFFPICK